MTSTYTTPSAELGDKNTDNTTLSPKVRRTQRDVENKEFDAFVRRILRAYSKRVSRGDIEALTMLCALDESVTDAIADAVVGLRDFGYSWTDVAARLGMTRQGARQRWTTKPGQPTPGTCATDPMSQDTLFGNEEACDDWA